MLNLSEVQNSDEALVYLTECNMRTVEYMAVRRHRPVNEYRRYILNAQKGVDWIRDWRISHESDYITDVLQNFDGDVTKWATVREHFALELQPFP